MKAKPLFLALAAALSLAASHASASEVVANPSNREALSEETLKAMLIGKEKFWSNGSEVVIAMLKSDPEAERALTRYCGMTSNKFKNHWQRIVFSGRGKMPKLFNSTKELVEFVASHEGAIAILPAASDGDHLRRVDLSGIAHSVLYIAAR